MFGRYGLLIVALGMIGLAAFGQAQEQQTENEQPSTQEEHQVKTPPFGIPVVIVESEEAAVAREASENEIRSWRYREHLAQWAATIISLFALIALIWTLCETRKATNAAVDAAEHAARSADAARDANNQTRENFLAERRPWIEIGHDGPREVTLRQNKLSLVLPVNVKNFGRSPAIDVAVFATVINVRQNGADVQDAMQASREIVKRGPSVATKESPVLPGAAPVVLRQIDFDIHPLGSESNVIVDYAIAIGYGHKAAGERHCTVCAYTVAFDRIPTHSVWQTSFSRTKWKSAPLDSGAYLD